MPKPDTTKLNYALSGLQGKYGAQIVQQARGMRTGRAPALGSRWPALDALTGCGGWPLGALSLLRGTGTCGALSLAHAALAEAGGGVLIDCAHAADASALADAGVPLEHLLVLRPRHTREALHMLTDAARSGRAPVVVFDSLPALRSDRSALRALPDTLAALIPLLRTHQGVCLLLDDDDPPHFPPLPNPPHRDADALCALVIELQHTGWRYTRKRLSGFVSQATLIRSRWRKTGAGVALAFSKW